MCDLSGLKCDAHGRQALERAKRLVAEHPSRHSEDMLLRAQWDYDLTLEGRNELRRQAFDLAVLGDISGSQALYDRAEELRAKWEHYRAGNQSLTGDDEPLRDELEMERNIYPKMCRAAQRAAFIVAHPELAELGDMPDEWLDELI